jgi:AcrR family transcriptional regulator
MPSQTRTGRDDERFPPPRTATRDARRLELEDLLISAAERLMEQEYAFSDISIDDLAREAGVSRATFYRYFTDKGDLVERICQRLVDELVQRVSVLWGDALPSRDDVHNGYRALLAFYRDHVDLFTAVGVTAGHDKRIAAMYRSAIDGIGIALAQQLERGRPLDLVRDVPLPETAIVLTWMLERTCSMLTRNADDQALDRLAEALTEIVWNSVIRAPAS